MAQSPFTSVQGTSISSGQEMQGWVGQITLDRTLKLSLLQLSRGFACAVSQSRLPVIGPQTCTLYSPPGFSVSANGVQAKRLKQVKCPVASVVCKHTGVAGLSRVPSGE